MSKFSNCIIKLESFGDHRGAITVSDGFPVDGHDLSRAYWMTDLKSGEPRGFHAHKSLWQVAICPVGRCEVVLDDGSSRERLYLEGAQNAVIFPPMVWHELYNFSDDCCVLVLASASFDETDYIRDYEQFLAMLDSQSTSKLGD